MAFVAGVVASEIIRNRDRGFLGRKWPYFVLVLECAILLVIGFLPATIQDIYVTIIISFVASLQVSSFKRMIDSPYSTTMMTGNFRSLVESCYDFFSKRNKNWRPTLRYVVVVASFVGGGATSALFISFSRAKSIWLCCGLILLVLLSWERGKRPRPRHG